MVGAWTPGVKVTDTSNAVINWGWKKATTNRIEDGFVCPANQYCTILNITFNGTIWAGVPVETGYRPTYAVHDDQGMINVVSKVNISCCQQSANFPYLMYGERRSLVENLTRQ